MSHPGPAKIRLPAPWQRAVAWACLGLVVCLNLLAATPQLHTWLHDQASAQEHRDDCDLATSAPEPHEDDAACVITQFANGQVGAEAALTVVVSATLRQIAILPDRTAPFAGRSHVLLPPGCGPPQV